MSQGSLASMVNRSMPNLNKTFWCVLDRKYEEYPGRLWLIWAGSRDEAIECLDIWGRWQER